MEINKQSICKIYMGSHVCVWVCMRNPSFYIFNLTGNIYALSYRIQNFKISTLIIFACALALLMFFTA